MSNRDFFNQIEKYQSFPAGQPVFSEGESGASLYIVAEGEVDIMRGGRVLETVGPGGIVGELALIDDKPRSASAIARTDCLLAPVNREHFLALVQRTPLFALQVMRAMANRLRHTTSLLRD
ncbi:MAG: cyclic nucleotide-binding domain-containing protein [Candidatus Competibacteraceae bacterium]|nr:cyclic nucleotide-binding domain-containing protein [Candidatus Competibacteraceae bacterium]